MKKHVLHRLTLWLLLFLLLLPAAVFSEGTSPETPEVLTARHRRKGLDKDRSLILPSSMIASGGKHNV